jgi:hypothetical protein
MLIVITQSISYEQRHNYNLILNSAIPALKQRLVAEFLLPMLGEGAHEGRSKQCDLNLPSPALSGTLSHQWARAFLLSISFMAGIAVLKWMTCFNFVSLSRILIAVKSSLII